MILGIWDLQLPRFQSSLLASPQSARMEGCGGGSQGQARSALHHFCSVPLAELSPYKGSRKCLTCETEAMKFGEHTISALLWIQTHTDFVFHSMLMA